MKPIATAFRLHLQGHDKDPDIAFSCKNTKWFGVLYLAESSTTLKKILALGYRLPKKGKYYVLSEH